MVSPTEKDPSRLYDELANILEEEGKSDDWIPVHARALRAAKHLPAQDAMMMLAALQIVVSYDQEIKRRFTEERPIAVYNLALSTVKAFCETAEKIAAQK
jgi:hypothetical protein